MGEGPPILEAWNKIDQLEPAELERVVTESARRDDVIPVSATTGEGVDNLQALIAGKLTAANIVRHLTIDGADGASLAWLYERGEVLERSDRSDGSLALSVRLSAADWSRFEAR